MEFMGHRLCTRLRESVHTDKTGSLRLISDQESQLKKNKYTQNHPLETLMIILFTIHWTFMIRHFSDALHMPKDLNNPVLQIKKQIM